MKKIILTLLLAFTACCTLLFAQDNELETSSEELQIPVDTVVYNYQSVQEVALFIGGDDSLNRLVRNHLKVQKVLNYTAQMVVSVVINKDSTIENIKLVTTSQNLDPYAKNAIIQSLSMTNKQWVPAIRNGEYVRSRRLVELDITWK